MLAVLITLKLMWTLEAPPHTELCLTEVCVEPAGVINLLC